MALQLNWKVKWYHHHLYALVNLKGQFSRHTVCLPSWKWWRGPVIAAYVRSDLLDSLSLNSYRCCRQAGLQDSRGATCQRIRSISDMAIPLEENLTSLPSSLEAEGASALIPGDPH